MKLDFFPHFLPCCWLALLPVLGWGQYDGAAGTVGSLAIYKNDFRLRTWASSCQVLRGYRDIAQPDLGQVSSGTSQDACGRAGDGQVLSLGDRGEAVLYFDEPLRNGSGADLVVFENGFSDYFLELAFVEISHDGQNFYRFASVSNTDTSAQVATFGLLDPSQLHNLAGKYRANYGTGFDFAEFQNEPNLNINAIQYVKIVSVTGSIQPAYADRDSRGFIINEPYPTNFDVGGFDLDAVAGIYPLSFTGVESPTAEMQQPFYWVYEPNCLRILAREGVLNNQLQGQTLHFSLFDPLGRLIHSSEAQHEGQPQLINCLLNPQSCYYLRIQSGDWSQILPIATR